MRRFPYDGYRSGTFGLKDLLAIDRTILANQRTWLAAARTSLALFVSGATFQEFFDAPILQGLGLAMMLGALPVLLLGWRTTRRLGLELDEARALAIERATPEELGLRPPESPRA